MKALNQSNPKLSHEYRLATRSLLLTSRILNHCVGEMELPLEFQEEWQALVKEHNDESDRMQRVYADRINVGTKPNAADRKTKALKLKDRADLRRLHSAIEHVAFAPVKD